MLNDSIYGSLEDVDEGWSNTIFTICVYLLPSSSYLHSSPSKRPFSDSFSFTVAFNYYNNATFEELPPFNSLAFPKNSSAFAIFIIN